MQLTHTHARKDIKIQVYNILLDELYPLRTGDATAFISQVLRRMMELGWSQFCPYLVGGLCLLDFLLELFQVGVSNRLGYGGPV